MCTSNINTPPCYKESTKSESTLSEYQLNTKPRPMTRELFILTMERMGLAKKQQDELLQYKNKLQSEKDLPDYEEE